MTDLPPLDRIDKLLASFGDFGQDEGYRLAWDLDRPFTCGEAREMVELHRQDPHTLELTHSQCTLRDAALQMRFQAAAFTRCGEALLADDENLIPEQDAPGSGYKEAREIISLGRRVSTELMGTRQQMRKEVEALAASYISAASACSEAAAMLDATRAEFHHETLARRALDLVET